MLTTLEYLGSRNLTLGDSYSRYIKGFLGWLAFADSLVCEGLSVAYTLVSYLTVYNTKVLSPINIGIYIYIHLLKSLLSNMHSQI